MATRGASAEFVDRAPFTRWHVLIDRGDSRFARLAALEDVAEPLATFEATIRLSMWNMQRHWTINDLRDESGLTASLRRKGVEMRMLLPRRVAEQRCPLASSSIPHLRLAPVAHPLMIGDGRRILVGDATGDAVWTSSESDLVSDAVVFYERVWRSAEPAVPAGEGPPFTHRMVDVALHLVDGATDREIARALGVSERTVSGDVREMSNRLGARSRAQAIALISGVEG